MVPGTAHDRYQAGRTGGTMTGVFSAANEEAVAQFLDKKIGYFDIFKVSALPPHGATTSVVRLQQLYRLFARSNSHPSSVTFTHDGDGITSVRWLTEFDAFL